MRALSSFFIKNVFGVRIFKMGDATWPRSGNHRTEEIPCENERVVERMVGKVLNIK